MGSGFGRIAPGIWVETGLRDLVYAVGMGSEPSGLTSRKIVWQAKNPDCQKTVEVELWSGRLVWARRMGIGAVRELSESVPHVLLQPTAIYRGLRRDEDDPTGRDMAPGWVCFCGKPPCRYDLSSGDQILIAHRVLLVFVNDDHIVYLHYWTESADEQIPLDADKRFRERL